MGKEREKKKHRKNKVVEAEIEISMHCNACERSVAKAISKIKEVETFATDMRAHRVMIKGRIIPEKLVKKLEKKTGKKVGILSKDKEKDENSFKEDFERVSLELQHVRIPDYIGFESILLELFSDENPNACSIM